MVFGCIDGCAQGPLLGSSEGTLVGRELGYWCDTIPVGRTELELEPEGCLDG